ncbi:MAG TPA: zf-HC2 domain-containing protein [Bacteroidota bacterium]|nr:zf-HC2 domain-containing protein [Bacteroidota bacterium]
MTHLEFQQQISLHVDNALGDAESAQLFMHLAECGECRAYLKLVMRVGSHLASEELAEVPRTLDRRVFASVANPPAQRTGWLTPVWRTRISIPLPAAASIAFLLIVGSLLCYPLLTADRGQQPEIPPALISKIPPALQKPE